MQTDELLGVVWRRKLVVLTFLVLALVAGYVALSLQSPVYASSTRMLLEPEGDDPVAFFSQVDAIVPIYAEAATSTMARTLVEQRVDRPLGEVRVETFPGTSILELEVRAGDPQVAAEQAQALADALVNLSASGQVGLSSVSVEQLEMPAVNPDPVEPRPVATYAVCALAGLAAGVSGAVARERLAGRIETVSALARLAGVPCFAEVPNEPAVERLRNPEQLASDPQLRAFAEALRDLRTNLLYSCERLGTIVVTSPDGHHGKTTIAYSLAVTMARLGTRTLLVDGDLRRGRLADMVGVARSPGMRDALEGRDPSPGICRSLELPALDLLPSGELHEDPGELFDSSFSQVVKQLHPGYELVIVDAPPLMPVNDARVMASFADVTLVVVSAGETTSRQLRAAIERLKLVGVEPTAVVLNRSRVRRPASYYSYLEPKGTRRRMPRLLGRV